MGAICAMCSDILATTMQYVYWYDVFLNSFILSMQCVNMYVKSFELFDRKTDHSANVFQMCDKFNYKYVFFLFYQCNV